MMQKVRRAIATLLCMIVMLGAFTVSASAAQNTEDIVILYENDVHCNVEGYSKLSAMKKELLETYAHVGVVSSGDYIQGSSYGIVSRGAYIVELMNLVGYDAIALGNHEFDYHLSRLDELIGILDTKPICCNFRKLGEQNTYFDPYSIVSYGDVKVAYVGITTPTTVTTTSSPSQFKDEAGNYIFTFHPDDLYEVVQASVDAAIGEGADYVIALSHIGDQEISYDIEELIESTSGLDVVLDAHSHSVIEQRTVIDLAGDEVLLSSTGTQFEHIGKLTISGGEITTELIRTEEYERTDPVVDAYLKQIEEDSAALFERKVAFSEVHLITHDENGNRLVRVSETNLGDFCSDAIRYLMDADIGYINGGGLRAEIPVGDITYNDLLSVFPFQNTIVLAKIDGQTLLEMLEMALMEWPEECSFPHVSGVTFSVNAELPSSVIINEHEEFCGFSGPYRVYDIKVQNGKTGEYEPIDPGKTYTIASNNYYLIEHGSGMTMLERVEVLRDDGMLDVQALETYIVEALGGVIGEEYREVSPNITFTQGFISSAKEPPRVFLILSVALSLSGVAVAAAVAVLWKKHKGMKR